MNNKFIKRAMALVLAMGIFSGGGNITYANEVIDPLVKDYIPKIENGEILVPQYMDGKSPSTTDWINSVKKQAEISKFEGAVKWSPDKKNFKIKKVDQNGNPVKGVTFNAYNTELDAKNGANSIGSAVSDDKGDVIFKDVPLYYQFYIKETKVPDGYTKSDEIIPVYRDNGVRFLGEMNLTNLNSNIKGGTEKNSLSDKGTKNLNTYLQSLVSAGYPFNNNTNWLVYNDNGIEKLVSKNPLKRSIAWNSLYNAGVVFGEDGIKDLINADFTYEDYGKSPSLKDSGKGKLTPKTYKSQYVNINGKTYIVRLMRAYNENAKINDDRYWGGRNLNTLQSYVKGSEWNRLILPLIENIQDDNHKKRGGRYGSDTKGFVENNMPALANYSWWKDFGGKNSNGMHRWAQETGYYGAESRTYRGDSFTSNGAAEVNRHDPYNDQQYYGWFVVLERVS